MHLRHAERSEQRNHRCTSQPNCLQRADWHHLIDHPVLFNRLCRTLYSATPQRLGCRPDCDAHAVSDGDAGRNADLRSDSHAIPSDYARAYIASDGDKHRLSDPHPDSASCFTHAHSDTDVHPDTIAHTDLWHTHCHFNAGARCHAGYANPNADGAGDCNTD